MSRLTDFYKLEGTDTEGRRLQEMWQWSDEELEETHDYIQWWFPLPEPSQFNPDAPLLTQADIEAFKSDSAMRNAMRHSFARFMEFLGLHVNDNSVERMVGFPARKFEQIWRSQNHNWLRITRALKGLRLCGLKHEAASFWSAIQHLEEQGYDFGNSFTYWQSAAQDYIRGRGVTDASDHDPMDGTI